MLGVRLCRLEESILIQVEEAQLEGEQGRWTRPHLFLWLVAREMICPAMDSSWEDAPQTSSPAWDCWPSGVCPSLLNSLVCPPACHKPFLQQRPSPSLSSLPRLYTSAPDLHLCLVLSHAFLRSCSNSSSASILLLLVPSQSDPTLI